MVEPVVQIDQGKLRGNVRKLPNNAEYYSFKGIPYAKPPVGELRFCVPQPPQTWEGERDATKDCNICAQFEKTTNTFIGEEDCLYLNVYTPKLPSDSSKSKLLPVMVYLHGGGFVFGNGTDDSMHGPELLLEKDVVMVGLNYRVGILGFLALDRKDAPGNMGLRDQVQALKWIQQSIIKFNGDSKNVTIFGISAGGASVEYLLLAPMARGLFHKAINQSGSSLLHWAQSSKVGDLAASIPLLTSTVVTDNDQLLKYLKAMPTKQLIMASMTVLQDAKFRGGIHFGFVPTVEHPGDWEPFLDKSPHEILTQGEFAKVPYIIGFCEREGLLVVHHGTNTLEKLVEEKDFTEYLPFQIDDTEKNYLNAKCKSIYLEKQNKYDETDAFGIDFFTDVDFLGGIYVSTYLIAKSHSPVYFYEFSYDGKLNYLKTKWNINRRGACHGDDGGYLIKSSCLPEDVTETDKLVRARMVRMWTNFARHGDPTPKLDDVISTKWEPIADTRLACLCIDDKLTMKHDIYPERMNLFQELYKKYKSSN